MHLYSVHRGSNKRGGGMYRTFISGISRIHWWVHGYANSGTRAVWPYTPPPPIAHQHHRRRRRHKQCLFLLLRKNYSCSIDIKGDLWVSELTETTLPMCVLLGERERERDGGGGGYTETGVYLDSGIYRNTRLLELGSHGQVMPRMNKINGDPTDRWCQGWTEIKGIERQKGGCVLVIGEPWDTVVYIG